MSNNPKMQKGQGIFSEIMAIINEIRLGKYKTDVAMKLREVITAAWNIIKIVKLQSKPQFNNILTNFVGIF